MLIEFFVGKNSGSREMFSVCVAECKLLWANDQLDALEKLDDVLGKTFYFIN